MNASANTPVAPITGSVGSQRKGGHHVAFMAQPKFDTTVSVAMLSTTNPWRPNTPGYDLFERVLRNLPGDATVQTVLDNAQSVLKFRPAETMGHLRWLYTWGGAYIAIGGCQYPEQPVPPAPKAKKEAKKSK